jgi:hypothetical protein
VIVGNSTTFGSGQNGFLLSQGSGFQSGAMQTTGGYSGRYFVDAGSVGMATRVSIGTSFPPLWSAHPLQ